MVKVGIAIIAFIILWVTFKKGTMELRKEEMQFKKDIETMRKKIYIGGDFIKEYEGIVRFYEYDIMNMQEGGIDLINTQVLSLDDILRKNNGKKIKVIIED